MSNCATNGFIFLLILFRLMCVQTMEVTNLIKYYEVVKPKIHRFEDSHAITVKFLAFSHDFELWLQPEDNFIPGGVLEVESETGVEDYTVSPQLEGTVLGDKKTNVIGYILDTFSGTIILDNETYYVEPANKYLKDSDPALAVVYRKRDIDKNFCFEGKDANGDCRKQQADSAVKYPFDHKKLNDFFSQSLKDRKMVDMLISYIRDNPKDNLRISEGNNSRKNQKDKSRKNQKDKSRKNQRGRLGEDREDNSKENQRVDSRYNSRENSRYYQKDNLGYNF